MIRSGRDGKRPCKLWLRSKSSQASSHLITEPSRAGFNFLFVQRQEAPVAHHNAAVNYYRFYIIRFGGVNEVGINVVKRNLVKRVAFDNYQIGALPLFYRSNFGFQMQSLRAT